MPMAFAMTPDLHEVQEEMIMTPAIPMSFTHCANCAKTEVHKEHAPLGASGCAGHCISQAHDTILGLLGSPGPSVSKVPPAFLPFADISTIDTIPFAMGPPNAFNIPVVVLRL